MNQQQSNQQQSPGIIKNPSTGVPKVKGPELNDRDLLNDILATEKYITDNFNIFSREASHEQLHQVTMGILNETHQAARDAYNVMFKKGWYKLNSAQTQTLQQTQQQFTNYSSQFPYGNENMH